MVNVYGPLNSVNDVVAYLEKIGESVAEGKTSLPDALAHADTVLDGPHCDTFTHDQREATRTSYKRQYEQRETDRALAASLGNAQQPQPIAPPAAPPVANVNAAVAPPAAGVANAGPDDGNGHLVQLTDEELRELQAKRRKREEQSEPNVSDKSTVSYAWLQVGSSTIDDSALHPVVRQTRKLVLRYTEDLDAAKRSLMYAADLPTLPDAVWRSILKDEYVDLDKIYSAYNSSVDTRKRSEKIAEGLWLQSESDAPTKKISTYGDWMVIYLSYTRGVLTAFPHRRNELETWCDAISAKFRTLNVYAHKRVIALEAASRRHIFDSPALCLLDKHILEQLAVAWTSPNGTDYSTVTPNSSGNDRPRKKARTSGSTSSSNNSSSSGPRPVCNNWNGKGCTYNGCRYRHVCGTCGGSHPKPTCSKAASS